MPFPREFRNPIGLALATILLSLLPPKASGSSGTAGSAFAAAQQSVGPALASHVVSLYGIGTPTQIHKWYIIFFDPAVRSHGQVVLITDNQVTRTYPAEGRTTYKIDHTFDVARITGETPALLAAQSYAATHHIRYNAVRALLHEESIDKPFYWKITLLRGESLRGAVYVRAVDGAFSEFVPAPTSESSSNGFTNDVKRTFLGVGGDLEEFFTGNRTVDQ